MLCFYGGVHFAANQFFTKTATGAYCADYLKNWKADGWVHGILCALTVFTFGVLAIFALGMALRGVKI
jgi:hypothetical protein